MRSNNSSNRTHVFQKIISPTKNTLHTKLWRVFITRSTTATGETHKAAILSPHPAIAILHSSYVISLLLSTSHRYLRSSTNLSQNGEGTSMICTGDWNRSNRRCSGEDLRETTARDVWGVEGGFIEGRRFCMQQRLTDLRVWQKV